MQPDPTTDSLDNIKAEMMLVPEVAEYMDKLVYEDARDFLVLAFKFAKKWALLGDRYEGRRLLVEAKLWLAEANKRADQEIAARRKPRSTAEAFRR